MKKMLFGILIILIGCATATLEQRQSTDIIYIPGSSKDQIFDRSMVWIHTQFGSGKAVMEYQDKTAGRIIGNVSYPIAIDPLGIQPSVLNSNMVIDIKDGKVRFQLTARSITFEASMGNPSTTRDVYEGELDKVKASMSGLKNHYASYIKTETSKTQEW